MRSKGYEIKRESLAENAPKYISFHPPELKQWAEIENLMIAACAYNKVNLITKLDNLKRYLRMEQDNKPEKIRKRISHVNFCFHIFLPEKSC